MRLVIALILALAGGSAGLQPVVRAQQSPQDEVRAPANAAAPERTRFVAPVYPNVARAARVQGAVVLEVTITSTGKVQRATVLRSIPLLDQAAIDAVMQWEYRPTRLNGVAVPIVMTTTVNFVLPQSADGADRAPVEWFGIPQSLMPTGPAVPHVRRAHAHLMAARFAEAAEAMMSALKVEPGNATCWFMMGGIRSHNRNPERNLFLASAAMSRALELGLPGDSFMSRTARMVIAEREAAETGSETNASVPSPAGAVPFAGRWQCTVYGSEALMNQFSFTVNDDGTVSLAGLAEEPRAAITSSSIQFESRGGGTVDSTSLRGNSSRMDGTRTLTTPAMGVVPATNTSHRVSCVPSEQRRPPTTTGADAPRSTPESRSRPGVDQQVPIQDTVSTTEKLGGSDSAADRPGFDRVPGDRDYGQWTCVPGSGVRCLPGRTSSSNDQVEVAEAGTPGQLQLRHDSGRPLVVMNVYRRASWTDNGIEKVQIDLGIANNTHCGFRPYAIFFENGNVSEKAIWPSKGTEVAARQYEIRTVVLQAMKASAISVEASGWVRQNVNGVQCY